jgi:cytochrome c-type biogenesis protein
VTGTLAAIGPDGPWAYYLALGMVATVNPCGFAMLPAYLSFFLGLEGDEREAPRTGVAQAVWVAGAVSLGFLAVFALAGLAVELTSLPVYENAPWISLVIGFGLFGLGIALLCGWELRVALPRLDRGGRERTLGSMFVFGVSYAIASIGCALPAFLVGVAGTINRESVADGLIVFGLYALGMSLVLLALTVAIALARTSLVRFLRRTQPYIGRVAGGLVALAGAYVAYYGWLELRLDRSGPGELPASGITDRVIGWSNDVTQWVQDTGALRIAVVLAALLAVVAVAVRLGREAPTTTADPADQGASRETRQPVSREGSRS